MAFDKYRNRLAIKRKLRELEDVDFQRTPWPKSECAGRRKMRHIHDHVTWILLPGVFIHTRKGTKMDKDKNGEEQ